MVEIIERGTVPSDKEYDIRCKRCKTLFKFRRSEAEYVADQRDGDALVIECPLCSERVWRAA